MVKNNNQPNKSYQYPLEDKEILAKMKHPNYDGGSFALSPQASSLEKAKYELCEKILGYQEDNNLSDKKLRERTGLSQRKLEDILFTRIEKVNSDELINVASKLFAPCQVEIVIKEENSLHARAV